VIAELLDIVLDNAVELLIGLELGDRVQIRLEGQVDFLRGRLQLNSNIELLDSEEALIEQANVARECFPDIKVSLKKNFQLNKTDDFKKGN
jgi:hypothetical protein